VFSNQICVYYDGRYFFPSSIKKKKKDALFHPENMFVEEKCCFGYLQQQTLCNPTRVLGRVVSSVYACLVMVEEVMAKWLPTNCKFRMEK